MNYHANVIVSSCLTGIKCNYMALGKPRQPVFSFVSTHKLPPKAVDRLKAADLVRGDLLSTSVLFKSAVPNGWVPLKDVEFNPVLVCPEQMGGLPTPRLPSEITKMPGSPSQTAFDLSEWKASWSLINQENKDVTGNFLSGALMALEIAQMYDAKLAIFKAKSPSCGFGMVANGKFEETLVPGYGVTAHLFASSGIFVMPDSDLL